MSNCSFSVQNCSVRCFVHIYLVSFEFYFTKIEEAYTKLSINLYIGFLNWVIVEIVKLSIKETYLLYFHQNILNFLLISAVFGVVIIFRFGFFLRLTLIRSIVFIKLNQIAWSICNVNQLCWSLDIIYMQRNICFWITIFFISHLFTALYLQLSFFLPHSARYFYLLVLLSDIMYICCICYENIFHLLISFKYVSFVLSHSFDCVISFHRERREFWSNLVKIII